MNHFVAIGFGVALFAPMSALGQDFRDVNDILRTLAPRTEPQVIAGAERAVPARLSIDLDVRFALNSADLAPEAARQLDALAAALLSDDLRDERVLLAGHTDATGPAEYNLALSQRRANAVRDYLVRVHGVAAGRLATAGFGEERLKDRANPNAAANRRVEVSVLSRLAGAGE